MSEKEIEALEAIEDDSYFYLYFYDKEKNMNFLIDLFINKNKNKCPTIDDELIEIYYIIYESLIDEDFNLLCEKLKNIIEKKGKYIFYAYDILFSNMFNEDEDEYINNFITEYKDTIDLLMSKDMPEELKDTKKMFGNIFRNIGYDYLYYNNSLYNKYFKLAIKLENYSPYVYLAEHYFNKKDIDKCIFYSLLAREKDYRGCFYSLGNYFMNEGKTKQAIYYYKLSAKDGYSWSMLRLGEYYEQKNQQLYKEKKTYSPKITKLMEKYYLMAIEWGSIEAMEKLGKAIINKNQLKNMEKGHEYLLMAAKKRMELKLI